ncbi:hypothetical protein C7999DRAFT_28653 [Corynascus novoguineensis]|uniref:ABM domain-containing protein n=1 Tax=Corynascus novoguineensis TaxID=1126955 RepID=A0AAN7CYZ9_9PEZI|nr:hypothetical protein C7999DRAFT_28653 [Corynascus novoguineensis]
MAASPVVVFQTIGQSQPPAATTLDEIKKQDGFRRALFGVKLEDPETGILYTEWSSTDAAVSYSSSQLGNAKETFVFAVPQKHASGWQSAVAAPCTEVFTAYGAEDGFLGNLDQFLDAVNANAPEGFYGGSPGEGVALKEGDEKVVRGVLGWKSREAHFEAKDKPGAIQENIHLLRVMRRAVDLFHVQLREL